MATAPVASSTTHAPTQPTSEDFPPPGVFLRKFTVAEYHLMAKAGVFVDGDPFELLDGWITRKMTRNPPHDGVIQLLDEALRKALPADWGLRIRCAVTILNSEPEPDGALVRGHARDYLAHHPLPPDIGLIVEIADASLSLDRGAKGEIYARAALSAYWIINLNDAQIEVYSDPTGDVPAPAYRQMQIFHPNQVVPLILDGQQVTAIPVQDLLP